MFFTSQLQQQGFVDTVGGRNPAPVEVGSLSHYLQGPGGAGFLPSTAILPFKNLFWLRLLDKFIPGHQARKMTSTQCTAMFLTKLREISEKWCQAKVPAGIAGKKTGGKH